MPRSDALVEAQKLATGLIRNSQYVAGLVVDWVRLVDKWESAGDNRDQADLDQAREIRSLLDKAKADMHNLIDEL